MTNIQTIEIDGQWYADLSRFAVRWVRGVGSDVPVLYLDGKRVTKRWEMAMIVKMEADEHGGNANTA